MRTILNFGWNEVSLLPAGTRARSGRKLRAFESATIHWIGPFPRQQVETPRHWWLTGSDGMGVHASYHFIVRDGRCLQALPLDEMAWHAGDGANGPGNSSSVAVGAIPQNEAGEFSPATVETLRRLIAELAPPRLARHFDWTGKDCPRFYTPLAPGGDERWRELSALLMPQPGGGPPPGPPPAEAPFDANALAGRIMRGEFGNGAARVPAIVAAGFTEAQAREAQARVNALLSGPAR